MSNAQFEMLMVLLGFLAAGGFTLTALRMLLTHRARKLGAAREADPLLSATVDELRQDLDAVRGDLSDLHERMDFAERLLTRARDDGRVGPGS